MYDKILENFGLDASAFSVEEFGGGLINSTFKVSCNDCDKAYILQSVNNAIFKDVDGLSDNILRITEHIMNKLTGQYSEEELLRRVLTPVLTIDSKPYYLSEDGVYWRIFLFIKGSKTFDKLESEDQAFMAGKAFGEFQGMLSDLPGEPLVEVLPGFHNTAMRIDNFKKSVADNKAGRLSEVKEIVDYLLSFEQDMKSIVKKGSEGILPLRTVHQDTKLSNILFDNEANPLCVIDYDTVMPGYLCYDFGDAVRGSMNNGAEDDENLDDVYLRMDLFKAFAKGYAQSSKAWISQEEIDTLAFGAKLITYEQTVRFLDDYLNGDTYYKIFKPQHNLIRTKAQLAYFNDLSSRFKEMDDYVKNLYK